MPESGGDGLDLSPGGSVGSVSRPTPGERKLLWVLAVLALAGQLLALYLPGSPDGALDLPSLPGLDKLVHALIFGVPVYLLGRLTGLLWPWVAGFAAHAVVSEFVQWRLVPFRDGDPWDVVADLLGIGVAALLVLRLRSGPA